MRHGRLFPQLARYGVTGIASVGCYSGLLWVLTTVSSGSTVVLNAIAYAGATLLNYLLNFYWSFGSSRSHGQASWRFLCIVFVGMALNTAYVWALTRAGFPPVPVAISFSLLWPFVSFVSLRIWAFRG